MPTLIVSREAVQDLIDIWLYIAEDNPVNADRFLDRLEGMALKLAEFTKIGIDRPELAPELKSFPVDRYVLILPGQHQRNRVGPCFTWLTGNKPGVLISSFP